MSFSSLFSPEQLPVLVRLFSYLDSLTQRRLRRTCKTFDEVLRLPQLTSRVCIPIGDELKDLAERLKKRDPGNRPQEGDKKSRKRKKNKNTYAFLKNLMGPGVTAIAFCSSGAAFKCETPDDEEADLDGASGYGSRKESSKWNNYIDTSLWEIVCKKKGRGMDLKKVLLRNVQVRYMDLLESPLWTDRNHLALALENVVVNGIASRDKPTSSFSVTIKEMDVDLPEQLTLKQTVAGIWHIIDSNCAELSGSDWNILQEYWNLLQKYSSHSDHGELGRILQRRESSNGKSANLAHLELNSLRRATQHELLPFAHHFDAMGEDEWLKDVEEELERKEEEEKASSKDDDETNERDMLYAGLIRAMLAQKCQQRQRRRCW